MTPDPFEQGITFNTSDCQPVSRGHLLQQSVIKQSSLLGFEADGKYCCIVTVCDDVQIYTATFGGVGPISTCMAHA